ncbi:hypothetical protein AVEN_88800-1 [Araneus ventricosus]|uniref:Uncharacterized protein n=1 Tax=Araneus ventricosus TaxID=182803 RepID=A0A4Y2WFG9_ARAVE|nr:hypothetical protein AVEN_88800-1 [Araneus ventricosus]
MTLDGASVTRGNLGFGAELVEGSIPDSTNDPPYIQAWRTLNLPRVKRPPAGTARKFGEGMLASVDYGRKVGARIALV